MEPVSTGTISAHDVWDTEPHLKPPVQQRRESSSSVYFALGIASDTKRMYTALRYVHMLPVLLATDANTRRGNHIGRTYGLHNVNINGLVALVCGFV